MEPGHEDREYAVAQPSTGGGAVGLNGARS